jgi:hypothetical protein
MIIRAATSQSRKAGRRGCHQLAVIFAVVTPRATTAVAFHDTELSCDRHLLIGINEAGLITGRRQLPSGGPLRQCVGSGTAFLRPCGCYPTIKIGRAAGEACQRVTSCWAATPVSRIRVGRDFLASVRRALVGLMWVSYRRDRRQRCLHIGNRLFTNRMKSVKLVSSWGTRQAGFIVRGNAARDSSDDPIFGRSKYKVPAFWTRRTDCPKREGKSSATGAHSQPKRARVWGVTLGFDCPTFTGDNSSSQWRTRP